MHTSTAARQQLWSAIALIVIALGTYVALLSWGHRNEIAYPHASIWQDRLIGFIWILWMLAVFKAVARARQAGSRIAHGLFAIGGLLYAIRIGGFVIAGWPFTKDTYSIAIRTSGLDDSFIMVSPFIWFLAIGCCAINYRWIRETLSPYLARLSSPVFGMFLFLAIFRGLHMVSTWANSVFFHQQSIILVALAIGHILLPFLYLFTYVLLTGLSSFTRQRTIEWAVTGVILGLAFTIPRQLSVHGIWAWLGDAGTAMTAIGVAALGRDLLSRRRATRTA